MKILLVCALGMSTGLLMLKMEEYWAEQGVELKVDAVSIGDFADVCHDYDIIMVGPQMAYRINEIVEGSGGMTVAAIPAADYAIHNCANIMKLAQDLCNKKD